MKRETPGLQEIEALTKTFADARELLSATVAALNEEREQVLRNYLKRVKDRAAKAKEAHAALHAAIEGHPEIFVKPRTLTVHGVKIGFQKGKGKVSFASAEKVVELIEKRLAGQAEILVITEKKPNKEVIAQLEVADLRRIGCTVTGTSDQVVIKDTAGEVDKLVAALLKDEAAEAVS